MEQAVTLRLVLLMDLVEVLQIAVVLVVLLDILLDLADDLRHGLALVQIDEPMQVVVSEILLVHHVVLLLGTVMFELQQTETEQPLVIQQAHGIVAIDEVLFNVVIIMVLVHLVVLLLGTAMFELQQTEIEQLLVIQQAHGIVAMPEVLFNVVIIMVHVSVQQAMHQLLEIMVHQQMHISLLRQLEPMCTLDLLLECEAHEVTQYILCTTIVMELHGVVIRTGIIHVRFLRKPEYNNIVFSYSFLGILEKLVISFLDNIF